MGAGLSLLPVCYSLRHVFSSQGSYKSCITVVTGFLYYRLKSFGTSFTVSSIGQLQMPGPLEITFPQLSYDPYEVDENITMLVHWNPGNFTIYLIFILTFQPNKYEPRHEISNNVVCVTS